jgi:phage major head subunit gpT-like protein
VPGSAEKNELLQILEEIPFHCQQLQVLVKSPTVGKTATFSKVGKWISFDEWMGDLNMKDLKERTFLFSTGGCSHFRDKRAYE